MSRLSVQVTRSGAIAALLGALALAGAAPTAAAGARPGSRTDSSAATRPRVSAAPATAVPKGFRANSITWMSPEQGWVLGSAPCSKAKSPDSGPPPVKSCAYVIGTTNGAKSWSLLSSINAPIVTIGQSGEKGVTEIRFATTKIGWVFGPELFRTTNGGKSWTSLKIPGGDKQVTSLAANSKTAYAVVSPCQWATSGPCGQQAYSLWRTATLTGSAWKQISVNLAPAAGMYNSGADVAVYDKTVYVLSSTTNNFGTVVQSKFYASTDGVHFSVPHDPCDASKLLSLSQAVPTSATDVALLCEGESSMGETSRSVYRSTNAGKTDISAGTPSPSGDYAELAASPSGNLAVSSSFGASWIFINDTHKTKWTTAVDEGDGGLGWNDIVYVTSKEAWIVRAPAEDIYGLAPGQVFVTHDAGGHWTVATL